MDTPGEKSGTDEGYWAETSAVYINQQHFRRFHTKENYCGIARFDHRISYLLREKGVAIAACYQKAFYCMLMRFYHPVALNFLIAMYVEV